MRSRFSRLMVTSLTVAVMAAPVFAGSGKYDGSSKKMSTKVDQDIVETAVSAGNFTKLIAAVQAAGLVETLQADGPFTVFAPTDEAFAKLPAGSIENLLRPQNREALTAVLTYHVVAGRVPAKQAMKLDFAGTVNGQRAKLEFEDDKLRIAGATVVAADIEASNGIIHVIDSVMLPSDKNIVETATAAGSFNTLIAALGAAELSKALAGKGPFTVFAPTDEAFTALPKGTVEELLKPENRDRLVDILKYHVVAGRVYANQALAAGNATTLQEGQVRIAMQNGTARINDSKILSTDIDATNGVIHVIDQVLIPAEGMSRSGGGTDVLFTSLQKNSCSSASKTMAGSQCNSSNDKYAQGGNR